MVDESTSNNESPGSKKKLLRILIIVAIGIPVLIELSTLFNLLKVQFWGKDKTPAKEVRESGRVLELTPGDTLSLDQDFMMTIREMRVGVSPRQWEFELEFRTVGVPTYSFQVYIDSIGLDSGMMLPGRGESSEWEREEESEYVKMEGEWSIPNGDIPKMLFMTLEKNVKQDSVVRIHKEVPLGSIPIRYRSDLDRENEN